MSKHFDRVNNRTRAVQLSTYTDNRPTVYRVDEPAQADNVESQGYDSLLGYWHILVRNKVTLLCFALAGLALAVLFSLLQTPDLPRANFAGNSGLQLGVYGPEKRRSDQLRSGRGDRFVLPDPNQDSPERFPAGPCRQQDRSDARTARERLGSVRGESATHARFRGAHAEYRIKTRSLGKPAIT